MIKLIRGRRYDTDRAKEIARLKGHGIVYQKRNGEFFEHHMLDKEHPIRPLSYDDAKELCRGVLDDKTFQKTFVKLEGKKRLNFILPAETVKQLQQLAISHHTTMTDIICRFVKEAAGRDHLLP